MVINKYFNHCIAACIITLCFIAPLNAQDLENQYPHWVQQWRTWANTSKDPVFIEWAETLSNPEAIKLGKEWEDFLGYNAVDLVEKDTKAPHIKPGLVITPGNIAKYEKELRELFPLALTGKWTGSPAPELLRITISARWR